PAPAAPDKPEPPVVGLGIAAGAKRPGAKKTTPAAPKPAAEAPPVAESKPEPAVVGLAIKAGAKRPGRR
ncbi:hypothetical protein, partial [Mycolicibacterium sp.]